MANLRIIYMGTPEFAVPCLDRLIQEGHSVAAVVTQPDRPKGRGRKLAPSAVKEFALEQGLTVLQPEKIREADFVAQLEALRPDMIVVVAFGQFLPRVLLDLPPLGCINVHASLLPKYRGAAPIHWAVMSGEKTTGVTTMFMDSGMDTGDMILKVETSIGPDETSGQLHDRLKLLGADVLAQTLELAASGSLSRTPQDNTAATYAPLLNRETERIDWNNPAPIVHNLVRGLNPWPGAYCLHGDKNLKIWRTEFRSTSLPAQTPGRVSAIGGDNVIVATANGTVELCEVQPENRRRMAAGEYARGYGLNVGEILG
ncbi:MAG: methionyl-tRNA formyltransferase [Negativicutes bacterium]|nr:methionyl-tRNA formyltransferase [Negativicutes bacterium]